MNRTNKILDNLKLFSNNFQNCLRDLQLCEDIRYLCDEVERLNREIVKANNFMDEDYITIQRYKNKIKKYESF
jgi:hypothetical protein